MTGIAPLFSRRYRDNSTRRHIPKAARAQGNDPVTSQQTASSGPLLDRECYQLDWLTQVEITGCRLVLPTAPGRFLCFGRVRIKVEPPAVCSDVPCPCRNLRQHNIEEGNHVFGAVFAAASCRQPASFVAVVVHLYHQNRLSNDKAIGRQIDIVLKGLPESPELLIITVCIDSDFLDHLVQRVEFLTPFWASRSHLLFILPNAGLYQTFNQRLAPRVTGHELFQFFLELLLGRK